MEIRDGISVTAIEEHAIDMELIIEYLLVC
jgi:hypothetical protein